MEKIVPEVVFQVAMVVKSVDTTIKQLTEYFQIDESSIVIKTTKDMAQQGTFTDCTYWGEPKEFYIKTARLSFGGIDFEYVEPLNQNGGDPFSDWLLKHGQGIHHINIRDRRKLNGGIFPAGSFISYGPRSDNQVTALHINIHTAAGSYPDEGICPGLNKLLHGNGSRRASDAG